MAEIWGAAIAAAGALAGGYMSSQGAKSAAAKSAAGSNAAIAEQARQYDTTRLDTAPYRAIGNQAINALGAIYGYKPAAQPMSFEEWSAANPSAFVLPKAPKQGFLQKHLGHALNPLAAFQDAGLVGGKKGGMTGYDQAQSRYRDYVANFNSNPVSGPKMQPGNYFGDTSGSGVDPSSGYAINGAGGIDQRVGIPSGEGGSGVQPGAGGAYAAGPPSMGGIGPDYSNFFMSPDYTFKRDEGIRGIERTASARGLTGSGNALAALVDRNQAQAADEFGNYFNRQAALAGIGQTAVNTATTAGMNSANNVSGYLQNAADARASGIAGSADAWGNALGTIGGIAYDRWGRPKKG